jgi:phosphatidylethanolamine/phosphatidyl-N-methylethanolamine N-methyltransferase
LAIQPVPKEEVMKDKAFEKDIAFWERMAPTYDRHVRWLGTSQERVILHLREQLQGAKRILDVGTGTGNIALALAQTVQEVDGVDPSPLMLEEARAKAQAKNIQNVRFSLQGAYELKFSDGLFDAVILSHVLHIIEKPELALSEAKRVLKKDGLLMAPTYCHGQTLLSRSFSFIARNLLKQPVYHRFAADDLVRLVRASGYEIVSCEILPDKIPVALVVALS